MMQSDMKEKLDAKTPSSERSNFEKCGVGCNNSQAWGRVGREWQARLCGSATPARMHVHKGQKELKCMPENDRFATLYSQWQT